MALAPVQEMTTGELIEYIEKLETENRELRAKTDNRPRLTDIEVRQIRGLAETGFTNAEIAHEYGVNPETVRRTINRTYHADVR